MDSPVEQEKSLKPMVQIEEAEAEASRGVRSVFIGVRSGMGEAAAKTRSEKAVTRAMRRILKPIVAVLWMTSQRRIVVLMCKGWCIRMQRQSRWCRSI